MSCRTSEREAVTIFCRPHVPVQMWYKEPLIQFWPARDSSENNIGRATSWETVLDGNRLSIPIRIVYLQ